MSLRIGIDIGSTTVKVVVLDEQNKLLFRSYERHYSKTRERACETLHSIQEMLQGKQVKLVITGSAGLGVANASGIDFVQEVYATAAAVNTYIPDTDAVIELGGEDAKIIFFGGALEERMNGSCAGGTGAFIDQMATLMNVTVNELDELSLRHTRIYPIASRCGVFAKTDIQPLLNQGAAKENIAASIYAAVASQTIAGLAQGRRIGGKVMFLGGPLYYCQGLRAAFREALKLDDKHALFPEYGRLSVALGAALYAAGQDWETDMDALLADVEKSCRSMPTTAHTPPLFASEEEYRAFCERHNRATAKAVYPADYSGDAFLGIDCGSTTTKGALFDGETVVKTILLPTAARPRERMGQIYDAMYSPEVEYVVTTGYGRELLPQAHKRVTEITCHAKGAAYLCPGISGVVDIGGQDSKAILLDRDGNVADFVMNDKCAAGTGRFVEMMGRILDCPLDEIDAFTKDAKPVDITSMCTVFAESEIISLLAQGRARGDIALGVIRSICQRTALFAQKLRPEGDLFFSGGLARFEVFRKTLESYIDWPVHTHPRSQMAGAIGAAIIGWQKIR